jgi:hypothetical protein
MQPAARLLMLAFALLVGCGDSGDATTPERPRSAAAHGVEVQLEPGWHAARENLTPKLIRPKDLLSVGTFRMRHGGECSQLPSRAYSDMGARDGLITIMEHAGRGSGFPPRPADFRLDARPGPFECAPSRLNAQQFQFRDAGRRFYAFVALGASGPQREVESILDSFSAAR